MDTTRNVEEFFKNVQADCKIIDNIKMIDYETLGS